MQIYRSLSALVLFVCFIAYFIYSSSCHWRHPPLPPSYHPFLSLCIPPSPLTSLPPSAIPSSLWSQAFGAVASSCTSLHIPRVFISKIGPNGERRNNSLFLVQLCVTYWLTSWVSEGESEPVREWVSQWGREREGGRVRRSYWGWVGAWVNKSVKGLGRKGVDHGGKGSTDVPPRIF